MYRLSLVLICDVLLPQIISFCAALAHASNYQVIALAKPSVT